jgi:hypothetical protein
MKPIMKAIWCTLVLAVVAVPSWATNRYTASCAYNGDGSSSSCAAGAGQPGAFNTIQACANAVAARDTCTVYAGTYNETPSLTHAGTSGSQITFTVNPRDIVYVYGFSLDADYNTINGFHITDPTLTHSAAGVDVPHSHTGDKITNNTITQVGGGPCIWTHSSTPSSYITMSGNTISWCAAVPGQSNATAQSAIKLNGDHFLIQNNVISHTTNGISGDGDHTIIRGNSYGPVDDAVDFPGCVEPSCDSHIDYVELIPTSGTHGYVVIENNTTDNLLGVGGAHFAIAESTGTHEINRYNTVSNVGSQYWLTTGTWTYVKDYNNTLYMIGSQTTSNYIMYLENSSTYGAIVNNLYYDVMLPLGGTHNWYQHDSTSATGFSSGFNLLYDSVCTVTCNYSPLASTDATDIKGSDPLFVNAPSLDFHYQSGSPALNAGTYLTTVAAGDSGSGTSLVVDDAAYFQDGYGISGVNADCLAVTSVTNQVCITAVNYPTNTLTLASGITRSAGDPVWLSSDSTGRTVLIGNAPNIGAGFVEAAAPAPPTGLSAVVQ